MERKNYNLDTRGEYILLALKNGAGTDYFTYNEEFIRVLDEWHISPFVNNGRLQCDCWKDKHCEAIRFYLYDLAYACYAGMLHTETLISDLQHYYDWKTGHGLTIDHADNNVHNNTVLNISAMPRGTNTAKSALVARFIPPYYLNSAFYHGEYRVQIAYDVPSDYINNMLADAGVGGISTTCRGLAAMHFLCDDDKSYVACLRYLWNSRYDWCNPASTPREHRKQNRAVEYWAGNINHSLQAQKILSLMKRSEFQHYRK